MNKYIFVVLLILATVSTACAQKALTGDEVAQKVFHRDDGDDASFKMEMTLIDKNGNERKRDLITYEKDYGELAKNFIRFLSPADIEGTGFLSWENDAGDDTQYLYLPDLGRSRRIVSSQRDLRFVNTDFTYEDMQRRKVDEDSHILLKEEPCQGYSCYVVEYTPKDEKSSQYSKNVQWIDKISFIPVKIEFYNKKGELFKRLTVDKVEEIDGIWTAMNTLMDDFSENHKTRLSVIEAVYNKSVKDEIFTLHNLEDY